MAHGGMESWFFHSFRVHIHVTKKFCLIYADQLDIRSGGAKKKLDGPG
jgi:hypothetical protein